MSNSHLFLKNAFVSAPAQNGVGRYICQLQRIVLRFCKENGASRGMRDFIESDLVNYAKDNPSVVVYLKPRRHHSAQIVAEYLNGDKQLVNCHNLSKEVITKWVNLLKSQAGNHEDQRFKKMWYTDVPSIQGPWTPYTFRNPVMNLAEFPNKVLGRTKDKTKSATEELLKIVKQQQEHQQ